MKTVDFQEEVFALEPRAHMQTDRMTDRTDWLVICDREELGRSTDPQEAWAQALDLLQQRAAETPTPMTELLEDILRRKASCEELLAQMPAEATRLRTKAQTYGHCAEMLRDALKRSETTS
jgi:hypothetical protein